MLPSEIHVEHLEINVGKALTMACDWFCLCRKGNSLGLNIISLDIPHTVTLQSPSGPDPRYPLNN